MNLTTPNIRNPWRHLPSQNWIYSDPDLQDLATVAKVASYLSIKVFTFAKDENLQFFKQLLI